MIEQGRSASIGGKILESLMSKIGSAAEHVKSRRTPTAKLQVAESSEEEDEEDSDEDYHSSEDEYDGDTQEARKHHSHKKKVKVL